MTTSRRAGPRDLLYLATPALWRTWPFLPVVRRGPGGLQCGVLYDRMGYSGVPGSSATVYLTNLFLMPATEGEFLALPREAYDTPEEVADAGWVID